MTDQLTQKLKDLSDELPKPRLNLSEIEKDALIKKVGPRAAQDIIKAKADFLTSRIPFLFSSIDTQAVVDLLANDMNEALKRALG